ncbi:MAG: hypothetical protein MR426_01750 [Clostridiales bacterium]|nr:hypothetical protein [Clostridiales bacterium]
MKNPSSLVPDMEKYTEESGKNQGKQDNLNIGGGRKNICVSGLTQQAGKL